MGVYYRRLRTLLALDFGDQLLVVAAAGLRALFAFALRTLPYVVWRPLFQLAVREARGASVEGGRRPPAVRAVSRAIERSSGATSAGRCLERALTGFVLLKLLGEPSTLRLGIGRKGGEIFAHAWVEHGGEVVINGPVDGRTALPTASDLGPAAFSMLSATSGNSRSGSRGE